MIDSINKFDYNIIKWIQDNIQNSFLDVIFKIITELGDKMVFILIVMILFWAVNKRFAYKFLFAFIGSAFINQVAKMAIQRPRPFKEDGIISIGSETGGSSFPSGHSQSSAVIFYGLNDEYGKRNKIIRAILIGILILVPLSRMYLAQHYLTDVVVGTLIGLLSAYLMFNLFKLFKDKEHIYPLYGIPVVVLVLLIFLNKDYNSYKDIFVAGAGYIGFTIGYAIEKIYIKHNVETSITNRILKVFIGLVIVAILYFGLKYLFALINEESFILDFIRYLTIALTATTLIPMLFKSVFKE